MNLILLAQTLAGSGLIALLVHILILAIVMGLIWWIITLIPLPRTIRPGRPGRVCRDLRDHPDLSNSALSGNCDLKRL